MNISLLPTTHNSTFYHIFMDSTSKALKNQIYVFLLSILKEIVLGTEHTNLAEFLTPIKVRL